MGMFDSTKDYERFGERFGVGDTFTVRELRVGPVVNTADYGESPTFIVNIDGTEYMGFGLGIVGQARDANPGDFPAEVMLVEKMLSGNRRMKQLVPVSIGRAAAAAEAHEQAGDDSPF